MTLSTEIPARTLDLQVRLDPAGKPLAIRHDGRIWIVDPATESRHWIGGDSRQATRPLAAAGGANLASSEYWRVSARLGSNSSLRTFTLRRNPRSVQWLLDDISDGG
ncbi:hypothetical protein [Arthrobacter sp. 131MFCol6.1]|uniref:hypothetical protein n=1 Tax=Arthrobacter sp. 131MFCol6.1 TaxID=1157944 RepID=UPI000361C991|nr:hypothetical protein [Arthrobacter sp. 131MFCol6.1]